MVAPPGPRSAWAVLRMLMLAIVLLAGLAGPLLQPQLREAGDGLVVVTDVAFVADPATEPPPLDAASTPRTLPDHWQKPDNGANAGWYRAHFELPTMPTSPWAIYIPRASTGYTLYLNGIPAGASADKAWSVSVPQMDPIAPQLLRPGGNTLDVRLQVLPDRRGGLTAIALGPHQEIERLYHRDHFARFTLTRSLNTALLVMGLLALMLWLGRPAESIYGWFGALAIVWSLRNFQYALQIDTALFSRFEQVLLGSLIVVVLLLWIFTRRFTGHPHGRTERWVLGVGAGALLALAVADAPLVHAARPPVGLACAGVGVWIIAMMVRHGLQADHRARAGVWVIVAAQVLALMLALSDLAVAARLLPFGPASRNAYGAPLILFAMIYALAENYFRTYDALRALSADLERRVEERTAALRRSHERVLVLERAATLAHERERLMRDMHDGIGSQLIVTLDAVEHGQGGSDQVRDMLRACLDDLRLIIDSLDPQESSLSAALANLRWRLEPRLLAAGIRMRWEVDEGVAAPSPSAVLHVLRIVQEAITNVVKHAGARHLRVSAQAQPNGAWLLEVEDDGTGVESPGPSGRGLGNMRIRARQLGGSVEVGPSPLGQGTCVRLRWPALDANPNADANPGTDPAAVPSA